MKPILFAIFLSLLIFPTITLADIGPKPEMDIEVKYNGSAISEPFSASILSKICIETIEEGGTTRTVRTSSGENCFWEKEEHAWGGDCKESKCHFSYYLPSQFKFSISLQNRTFESPPTERTGFFSTFQANLLPNGTVELNQLSSSAPPPIDDIILPVYFEKFPIAFILTLILESISALAYINRLKPSQKIRNRILLTVALGNIITVPIVWFVFPTPNMAFIPYALLSEAFAVAFEAALIFALNKKSLSPQDSFLLSIAMNLVSLFIGSTILSLLFWP